MGFWYTRSDTHTDLLSDLQHRFQSLVTPRRHRLAGDAQFFHWSIAILPPRKPFLRLNRYQSSRSYLGCDDAVLCGLHTDAHWPKFQYEAMGFHPIGFSHRICLGIFGDSRAILLRVLLGLRTVGQCIYRHVGNGYVADSNTQISHFYSQRLICSQGNRLGNGPWGNRRSFSLSW